MGSSSNISSPCKFPIRKRKRSEIENLILWSDKEVGTRDRLRTSSCYDQKRSKSSLKETIITNQKRAHKAAAASRSKKYLATADEIMFNDSYAKHKGAILGDKTKRSANKSKC